MNLVYKIKITQKGKIKDKFKINNRLEAEISANKFGPGFQIKYRTSGDEETA